MAAPSPSPSPSLSCGFTSLQMLKQEQQSSVEEDTGSWSAGGGFLARSKYQVSLCQSNCIVWWFAIQMILILLFLRFAAPGLQLFLQKVDWEGVRNLISALPRSVKRVVLVSSVGVTKSSQLPWSVMNLFGVLKYKKMGEDFLRNSGLAFTIIRPGRLTDGPYTSYDLNTLLKATAGPRRAVLIGQGDTLVGEVSRLVVAEACVQALDIECTEGQIYEVNSVEGEGPGSDQQKWRELFKDAQGQ